MKPLRVIERVAYGDGTPDELADDVPTWDDVNELADWKHRGRAYCADIGPVVYRDLNDVWCGRDHLNVPNDVELRWWIAVAIAVAAGCPPHWADMGMVADHDQWKLDSVYAWDEGGARWWVAVDENYGPQTEVEFPTEFEARCWVADRLGVEWGAK